MRRKPSAQWERSKLKQRQGLCALEVFVCLGGADAALSEYYILEVCETASHDRKSANNATQVAFFFLSGQFRDL